MMLLSAIAAVLLAVVAKRRIGAARPNYHARAHTPQEAHAEAHEAPPAAGQKRTMATIVPPRTAIDAAEVDEVFGDTLPPDVKQVINSLGGRNLRRTYPSAQLAARCCPASMIGATTTTPGPWQRPSPTKTSSS